MRLFEFTEKKIFWIVAFLLVTNIAVMRYHTLHEPFERDISGYAYLAHQLIEGKTLYLDAWDHKPPAGALCHALFQLLFGYNDISIYVMNVFFASLILVFVGLLTRRFIGTVPALLSMFLYALVSQSPDIQSNQPSIEIFINSFKLIGVYLLFKSFDNYGRNVILILSGLSIGVSSLFKPITVFSFAVLVVILFVYSGNKIGRDFLKKVGIFSVAAGIVWIAVVFWMLIQGSLNQFWEAVFVFNRDYLQLSKSFVPAVYAGAGPASLLPPFFRWEYAIAIMSIGFLGTLVLKDMRREKVIFIVLLVAAYLETLVPGWRHPHYYQLPVPFMVIMATWAFFEFVANATFVKAAFISLLFLCLVIIPLIFKNADFLDTSPDDISIQKYGTVFVESKGMGDYMKSRFLPNLTLFNWGAETGLYYYSKLDANTPYFYNYVFLISKPDHRKQYVERFFQGLLSKPPDVFVNTIDPLYDIAALEPYNLKDYLEKNYTLYGNFDRFVVYCHKRHAVGEGDQARCNIERQAGR